MQFGERMRQARLSLNWSQKDLSSKTGISVRSLYTYEAKNIVPRSSNMKTIADALNVSIFWLLDESDSDGSTAPKGSGSFLASVQEKYGGKAVAEASQLLERVSALFAGGELDEGDKDAFFQSLMEVYLESKAESTTQFAPGVRKKRKQDKKEVSNP